jgi:hypothetical protein
VYQGDTAFTRIKSGPHSQARLLVNWFREAAGQRHVAEEHSTSHHSKTKIISKA